MRLTVGGRALTVVALALVAGAALVGCSGSSGSSAGMTSGSYTYSSEPSPSTPTPVITTAAVRTLTLPPLNPCAGTATPFHLLMLAADGSQTPDLVMCTDSAEDVAVLTNTSTNVVWSVENDLPYWTPSQDVALTPSVRLFRAGIRIEYAVQNRLPFKTIEPGTRFTTHQSPFAVHLSASTQLESGFLASSLAVETATRVLDQSVDATKEKVQEGLIDLVSGESKDHAAMVTCVVNGYEAGKTLSETNPQPSIELFDNMHSAYGNTKSCAVAIDEAQKADVASGEVPEVKTLDLEAVGTSEEWIKPADSGLARFLKGVISLVAHEE